jgi:glycosyltransferase involved in cell wall biosynthesis
LIQTWLYHADLVGLIAGTLMWVPVVWNIRCADLDPQDHPRTLPWLLRVLARASRRPAAVIVNSSAGRRAHDALGYRPRRWELIPNGFDTDVFQPNVAARAMLRTEVGLSDATPLVGLLARRHPMKDHETFVRAAAIVAAREPQVHFVAAGRGVYGDRELVALIDQLGLTRRVHLLSERSDAPAFLAALDVAVSSSYSEAFPNVVAEAMACGTPCVATMVGDTADIVGECGVLVPPRDAMALAGGVSSLLRLDAQDRANMSRASRTRIESKFSLTSAVERYEQLYSDLMTASGTQSGQRPCAE